MPKSIKISCEQVADWQHVSEAFYRATRGKSQHRSVRQALKKPEKVISVVRGALLQGKLPEGSFHHFEIFDPKRRVIHAAPFVDRIAHHALIMLMEKRLEALLLPSVFACRPNKGVHKAIFYAQKQSRRFKWVMHLDIKHYFPNIDHDVLKKQLRRYFKGDVIKLIDSIIVSHQKKLGKGLPIGSLTSQYFANQYLNQVDRFGLSQKGITAHCRYMDDFLFWSDSKNDLIKLLKKLTEYLKDYFKLTLKPALIQATKLPLLYCGIHIRPFKLTASNRRIKRLKLAQEKWEGLWAQGLICTTQLQQVYASINTILLPAVDSRQRQNQAKGGRGVTYV